MKMPTTTNAKVEAKASTPATEELDVGKQCLNGLEKKVRNLEKRKARIEVNKEKASTGSKLEKEQEVSVNQYDQVNHELLFAKELHKQFLTVNFEHEKMAKKRAKKERAERQATEIKRVGEILRLQSTLDLLGGDDVRADFKTGKHGAVVLTDVNLDQLDKLYQAISPSRDDSGDNYPKVLNAAADHLVNILEGKDRQVMGTTYRELKELINLINNCGYFERARESKQAQEVAVETRDQEKECVDTTPEETSTGSDGTIPVAEVKEVPETQQQQQQPVDLSVGTVDKNAQSKREAPAQPINTLEQDAFFAPSSTPYQAEPERQFSQTALNTTPSGVADFQSFTHNRPFQFIQTSYVMPDSSSPTLVDPAVIVAQPAGASGLQFMSPGYDTSSTPTPPASLPPKQQQQSVSTPAVVPSQQPQAQNVNSLGLSQGGVQQQPSQQPQDFGGQNYSQGTLPQADNLFPAAAVGHDEASSSISSHSTALMGQLREESSSGYEIPPSIPLPPSQSQDGVQLEPEQTQLHNQEKKFPMNANAPVFQSMYTQGTNSGSVNVASSTTAQDMHEYSTTSTTNGDFVGHDFQGFQGGNNFSGQSAFQRSGGNRGGYRNQRGGPNGSGRGGNALQNGFGGRGGANNNNSRGGGRGGTYQGYAQNANYRPEGSFQSSYGSSGFPGNAGGFQQKRGGMNNAAGPGATSGYPRGSGAGANNGRGGQNVRGGMPRGGGARGAPRGTFNRQPLQS